MMERRQEPRVACVLEAIWDGQSGTQPCRVTDLSWHGCFVQSWYAPAVANEAVVTVTLGGDRVDLRGRVRYVEARMGFGLMFDTISFHQATAMGLVLCEPAVAREIA